MSPRRESSAVLRLLAVGVHPTHESSEYEDWTDLVGGRENGLKLAALRRLRPKGDLRWLWRARRMFPR